MLKDVQVMPLLLLDFSRVRNGRQPAEYGWEELSDSRCSVILRCGSVCAYEYASTISLAFGRWSSYCSAGRKERVARSKHAPSPDVLKESNAPATAVCSWRGRPQSLTARPVTSGSVLFLLPSVASPLHVFVLITPRRVILFFRHV